MRRAVAALAAAFAFASAVRADDGPPKPPAGWKEHSPADNAFTVWIPEKPKRQSERDRTSTLRGTTLKIATLHIEVADKLFYHVEKITLPAALAGKLKQADLELSLKEMLLGEFRGKLLETSEAKLGATTGIDYLIETGKGLARARVFVGAAGRVVIVYAEGTKEQVEDKSTLIFLESVRMGTGKPVAKNVPPGGGAEPPKGGERTKVLGFAFDPETEDAAPEGGLLVGLEIGLGKFVDNDVVKACRAVYRVGDKESYGKQFGTQIDRVVKVVAKPGYAVGAITAKVGLGLDGLSVTFMKVADGGQLDPKDAYESEWVGGKGGGEPTRVGTTGTPVVGIVAKTNKASDLSGLGLLFSRPAKAAAKGNDAGKPERTKVLGFAFDPETEDAAPEGGLLVGLEIGLGKFVDNDVVKACRAVYRVGDKESYGKQFGTQIDRVVKVVAKPGYAVGAITAKVGLGLDGLSVTFMKVADGGQLDPKDAYESEWVGGKGGGEPTRVGTTGTPVVGIVAKTNKTPALSGLGLLLSAKKE